MKQMRVFLSGAMLTVLTTGAAVAGDFVFGLGTTDFDENISIAELEYHADPFTEFAGADISFGGVAILHDNGDFFLGGGVSALRPFGNDWFVEGSFMPGVFENSEPSTDLGSKLEFRSLIGVGRTLKGGQRVSVGLSHKSNANLGSSNPGVNALTLRLRF